MAQKKPSFRFRIPWLTATQSFSRHPKDKDASKSSTQSDINVPIQRSSGRPSVITPAESPPGPTKIQEATRTEPQNQSPPHPPQTKPLSTSVVVEKTHSKPLSPSTSPNHVNSPPLSSYAAPQFHVFSTPPQSPSQYDTMKVPKLMPSSTEESTHPTPPLSEPMPQEAEVEPEMKVKVNSPLREITKSPENSYQQAIGFEQQTYSTPTSPEVSKTEPASQHHPLSPLASERKNEVLKANHEENTLHASSILQGEKDKMTMSVSDSVPNDAEPKMKSPLKTIPLSQQENLSEHTATKLDEERLISKTTPKSPLESLSKFLPHKGKANHKENTLHSSSTSQEQKVKIPVSVSNPMIDEAKPKMKSPLKTILMSQPETLSKHTTTKLDEGRFISKTRPKSPLETRSKFLQHKEKEKVVHETKKLGKSKDKSTSQPTRHAKPSSSGTKDKKHHGVRETVERKIMFATSNSSGKDIGVMSSKDPSSSISQERTVPSSDDEREKRNEKAPIQKGIKDDITKFVHKISASVQPTQPMDDKKFSVITLTGDNRGATMQVGSESDKKDGSIHIHRDYKTESEESIEVSTDGEGNISNEEDSTEHGEVGKAYVNSNIQSINNSLMFHGSVNERDPGVQVTLPQKPLEPVNHNNKDTHNQRTEFNMSRSQKSTFQPTVRRYGCKFSRGNNNEDIEIM